MSYQTYLEALREQIEDIKPIKISGKVSSVRRIVIEAKEYLSMFLLAQDVKSEMP